MKKLLRVISVIIPTLLILSCVSTNTDPNVYTQNNAMIEQQVRQGTILAIDDVMISNEGSNVFGTVLGGSLGYVIGDTIGGGKGNNIAKIAGAGAGAVIGDRAQNKINTKKAKQLIIKLDGINEPVAVIQDATVNFNVGEKVILIGSQNNVRVKRIN